MSKYLPALLGASMLVIAAPSQAALYDITYTGVVSSGYDQTGVFLGNNTDLAGQAFTAVFTLNYPVPAGAYDFSDPTYQQLLGGDYYGSPSFLNAKITINGKTDTVSGQFYDHALNQYYPGQDYVYHVSQDYIGGPTLYKNNQIYSYIQSTNDNYLIGPDITQSLNYTADSNDFTGGYFNFSQDIDADGAYEKYAYGNLVPSNVTVSVSAVPEQSTWAMMITAFGFAGTAFRRQKPGDSRPYRNVGFKCGATTA